MLCIERMGEREREILCVWIFTSGFYQISLSVENLSKIPFWHLNPINSITSMWKDVYRLMMTTFTSQLKSTASTVWWPTCIICDVNWFTHNRINRFTCLSKISHNFFFNFTRHIWRFFWHHISFSYLLSFNSWRSVNLRHEFMSV